MRRDPTRLPRLLYVVTLLAGCLAFLALSGCGTHSTAPAVREGSVATRVPAAPGQELLTAIDAQQRASAALLARGEVVGTGAGLDATGHAQVVVLLERAGASTLPTQVDGIPVVGLVVGPIQPWALTGSYRPVPIGVSVGNANECLPGTIGCVLQRGTRVFLLSANHVLARQNRGLVGEAIVQPSLPDLSPDCAPAPASAVVATLSDFQTIVYDGHTPNTMDAAIAEVTLPANQLSCATPAGYYGYPSSTPATAVAGMLIMKLARTTGLTHAQVKAVNVKTKITFPSGTALFVGQVLTTQGFGDFGDSGALVVTDDASHRPIGIVIGGGMNGAAIVTPIGPILSRFSATICSH